MMDKNKRFIITIAMLLSVTVLFAQTRVEKKIASKSNKYGVTYSLPKTSLVINAEVIKQTCKAGPYYRYAEKYLGVKNPVTEDEVYYELGKVTLSNKGVPDPENTYIVEFKAGTTAPYVYLTEDGLMCSINADYTPQVINDGDQERGDSRMKSSAVLTEELLMAGSVARQAEVAAKQIYHIRQSRMDILTGDADNLPPDGDAMKLVIKQLEDQEKALTNLFVGSQTAEISYYDVTIVPNDDFDNEVLFRFSTKLGILDADDLGGTPVYMNLKATERAPELASKDAEKKEKSLKGLIYNVPGKARVEILMNKNTLFKGEVQITQFGTQEGLAPVIFEDRKAPVKIYFYPETGAIKQIIQ
ncbi:MAG: DUF4831 family protein [Tannerella sp.]|jgi:hypothetical protein|nr:DUF4831 family protein [Tannerella sp.]